MNDRPVAACLWLVVVPATSAQRMVHRDLTAYTTLLEQLDQPIAAFRRNPNVPRLLLAHITIPDDNAKHTGTPAPVLNASRRH